MAWLVWLALGCGGDEVAPKTVTKAISAVEMKAHVDFLADDASQGRVINSAGHDEARDYVIGVFEDLSLQPLGTDGGFVHEFAYEARDGVYQPTEGGAMQSEDGVGQNLVAVIPGSDPDRADEYIVLVAHYDHLGVTENGNEVFNGAFDDAGGVAMVLDVARAIVDSGKPPGRSVLLLISDSEEIGLQGAEAWVEEPTVATEDLLAAISIDPVGRPYLPDYAPLALMGAERTPEFLDVLRGVAPLYAAEEPQQMEVRFLARDMIELFYSDQDRFLEGGVPAIWFTSPGMTFYHQVTDDPDTIDYRTMLAQGRWLAEVVYALDAHEGGFELQDPPPWDAFLLSEMDAFWASVLESDELDDEERDAVEAAREDLAPAVEAGDPSLIEDLETLKLAQLGLLFSITGNHPGPIPPPFPE